MRIITRNNFAIIGISLQNFTLLEISTTDVVINIKNYDIKMFENKNENKINKSKFFKLKFFLNSFLKFILYYSET